MQNGTPAINIVFQRKGGIGKSISAAWIAEYLNQCRAEAEDPFLIPSVVTIDADPSQKTLARIKALNARSANILIRKPDGEIVLNTPEMDALFSEMLESESSYVFDCGSSGFDPINSYLLANDTIGALAEARRVIVHSIIVAGRDHADTIKTVDEIISTFPTSVEKVLWLNPHFGELEYNGTRFEDSKFLKTNADNISGIVRMPKISQAFTETYFRKMMDEHLTFSEILAPENKAWNAIAKMRMKSIWNPIKVQLSEVL